MAELPTICQEKSKNPVIEDVLTYPTDDQRKVANFAEFRALALGKTAALNASASM
jgi:hypothetical protein